MNRNKLFSLLALVLFTSLLVSSCKTHERCPAYGKINLHESKEIKA